MQRRKRIFMGTLFAVLAASAAAWAGGPFRVDEINRTGVALRWPGDTMKYCIDPGKLSSKANNAKGTQWVKDALTQWTTIKLKYDGTNSVATATVQATPDTGCDNLDVNLNNYTTYISDSNPKTEIIFDDTGDIVADMMGEANRKAVVGLSEPSVVDKDGLHIDKGYAIYNGYLQASGILSSDQTTNDQFFQASMLHELGHLLNLDHGQVNIDVARNCTRNGQCDNGQYIPTMFPELKTTMQGILRRDDMVTISWIYPSDDFKNKFCTITGEVFDAKGNPLKGVNVLAANTQNPLLDVRSFVSGVLQPQCYGDSHYFLYGIVPGQTYQVSYEPLASEYTGASGFEPLDNPPKGFTTGTISTPSGDTTVTCDTGGKTIEMASVTIDVANPCAGSSQSTTGTGTTTTPSSSSSKCSLVAGGAFGLASLAGIGLLVGGVALIVRSRSRMTRRRV